MLGCTKSEHRSKQPKAHLHVGFTKLRGLFVRWGCRGDHLNGPVFFETRKSRNNIREGSETRLPLTGLVTTRAASGGKRLGTILVGTRLGANETDALTAAVVVVATAAWSWLS